jgi:hypothetical protein
MKVLGIINAVFITDQLLIKFFAFISYRRKKLEYNDAVYQLFIDFKKAYDSVRGE